MNKNREDYNTTWTYTIQHDPLTLYKLFLTESEYTIVHILSNQLIVDETKEYAMQRAKGKNMMNAGNLLQ